MDLKYFYKITTSAVILNDTKDKVLLGLRSKNEDTNQGLWSIPGGKLDSQEHTIDAFEENIIKEVKEEMGITIAPLDYLDSHIYAEDPDNKKLTVVFTAKILHGTPTPLEDTDEVRWFTKEEVTKINLPPNVFRVIEKVLK